MANLFNKSAIQLIYGGSFMLLFIILLVGVLAPFYWILLIPASLFLGFMFFLTIEKLLLLLAFIVPLSVKLMFGKYGLSLPDELLMLCLCGLFLIKLLEPDFSKGIWENPLTIAVGLNLLMVMITNISSSIPMVSFKFLLARTWVIGAAYLWGMILFKKPENIKRYILCIGLGLGIVVFYTTFRHWQNGFSQKSGTWVMTPFFDDHTAYSAFSAIVLISSSVLFLKLINKSFWQNLGFLMVSFCAFIAVFLSYSRAAWLSIIISICLGLLLKIKMKFHHFLSGIILIIGFGLIFHQQIYDHIRFNKATSGKDFSHDIQSISNVKTDDSNVERLNRWESGWRMFKERPFLGFGPGTYDFKYSSYQRAYEMTMISSTTGQKGGIHNEYFAPFVESGILGGISFILLTVYFFKVLFDVIHTSPNQEMRVLAIAVLLGLFTYFFHGLLNNFLNQDKTAYVFWSFVAMAAALHNQNKALIKKASGVAGF